MIVILERLVSTGANNIWYFDKETVQVMFVVFAQGHLPITTMYLSRLAISALQDPQTAPRTWVELFWLADRDWQNPFPFAVRTITMVKKRFRPSSTFLVFFIISFVALITPVSFSRAWSSQLLSRLVSGTTFANSTSLALLPQVRGSSQLSNGSLMWFNGLWTGDYYDADAGLDFFSGGSEPIVNLNVTSMPGILFTDQGCDAQKGSGGWSEEDLENMCDDLKPGATIQKSDLASSSGVITLHIAWCSSFYANSTYNTAWMQEANQSDVTAFLGIKVSFTGSSSASIPDGIIYCDTSFQTGTSDIIIVDDDSEWPSFMNFQPHAVPNITVSQSRHADVSYHPLYAVLYYMTLQSNNPGPTVDSILEALGFDTNADKPPTISEFALNLGWGAAFMANSLSSLAQESTNLTYTRLEYLGEVTWKKNTPYTTLTSTFLCMWFVLIVYSTFRMHKPTFSDNLNSYTAARLLADKPELVKGYCCGGLANNPLLFQKFGQVVDVVTADSTPNIGHVGVEKSESTVQPLSRGRLYGCANCPLAPASVVDSTSRNDNNTTRDNSNMTESGILMITWPGGLRNNDLQTISSIVLGHVPGFDHGRTLAVAVNDKVRLTMPTVEHARQFVDEWLNKPRPLGLEDVAVECLNISEALA
ncbi:hypothetical protein PUNSTDRAFT_137810 [Punctularia strigosozonata HHB-11173 SS5]|uniref:Uncharacterized protein n=1 Tax=Punctularia strigosozonata (strain HHB-11173) TaxID=741275 RepID=R7S5V5_PUNST|nr:uncharacterized protein PUNSTDRAFT_137810 [Punctularia strigosozonata HHB-11173 SS5]EIN05126.1 hypothetical protein PUNSTDRAFT_137810 [Punctularia strigosozonata HHB-11173 SS5]